MEKHSFDKDLFANLQKIRGVSGDEAAIAAFVKEYVKSNEHRWKVKPEVFSGNGFQDAVVLVFGNPVAAMYAHMDTIGYTVAYDNHLVKVGGPKPADGDILVGCDSHGEIECELMVIEDEDGNRTLKAIFPRTIERGTLLSFKPALSKTGDMITGPYMDNRMGVYTALQTAPFLTNGAIVFSTYEEHGGGSVGFLGKFLYEKYGVMEALICDITWKTNGVQHGAGVAVSMRDSGIPRKVFLDKIMGMAAQSGIPYQLEVESAGGSDGRALQQSSYPIDWVFVGSPEDKVHTPHETMHIQDINSMVNMYRYLMQALNR
jgi:putative aminopeptidase FrvX